MRQANRQLRGFTLVEVLVALVIVAIGMGALLSALGSAADNTSYLREKTFAQWVALNRVAEVRLQSKMPSKGKQAGETDFAGHKWQWEQDITALDVPGVLRMDVKVRMADSPPAKNAPWTGSAIGVMGDSIISAVPSNSPAVTWETDPETTEQTSGTASSTSSTSTTSDTSNTGNTSSTGNTSNNTSESDTSTSTLPPEE